MKVALCVAESSQQITRTCVPYGLGYIASYLREHLPEVNIKVFDGMAGHPVKSLLLEFNPDVVGVSATTAQIIDAYSLLGWVRINLPNALTVVGGVHVSALPEEGLEYTDVVVVGEGEIVFTEIIESLLSGRQTRGIFYGKTLENLDELPMPPYDLLDFKEYLKAGPLLPNLSNPIMNLLSSRGCPWRCPFCGNSGRTSRVRYFSAERIVKEILYIHNLYGVTDFYFSDDEFLINVPRFKQLAVLFKEKGIDKWIKWACQVRSANSSYETLKLARSVGLVTISMGLESGCQRMLDFWKNGTTKVSDHERVFGYCKKLGISAGGCFIFGGFDETEDEMQESFNWITNMTGITHVGIGTIIPYPGTEIWRLCKEKGLLLDPVDYSRLLPTNYIDQTYVIAQSIPFGRYRVLLIKISRLCRLSAEVNKGKGIKDFLKLTHRKAFWWGWIFHPLYMLRLMKKIVKLRVE